MTDSTDTPSSGDATPDLLAFAFATAIGLGAWIASSFVMNEVLRRKERRECEGRNV